MDLMTQIAQHSAQFGSAEQRLADFVRSNLHAVAFSSARELATLAGVSPATVVRFFPRVGYASFAAAQKQLQADMADQFETPHDRLLGLARHPALSLSDRALEQDLQNLATLSNLFRSAEYARLLSWLSSCEGQVGILAGRYSLGAAQLLASQFSSALTTRLLNAQDGNVISGLMELGPEDVVLCLSIRRYLRTTVSIAKWLKQRGVRTVALTDSKAGPLALVCDLSLVLPTKGAALFDSYTSFVALGNAIVAELAAARQSSVAEKVRGSEDLERQLGQFYERAG